MRRGNVSLDALCRELLTSYARHIAAKLGISAAELPDPLDVLRNRKGGRIGGRSLVISYERIGIVDAMRRVFDVSKLKNSARKLPFLLAYRELCTLVPCQSAWAEWGGVWGSGRSTAFPRRTHRAFTRTWVDLSNSRALGGT